jgi:hypothetical protein
MAKDAKRTEPDVVSKSRQAPEAPPKQLDPPVRAWSIACIRLRRSTRGNGTYGRIGSRTGSQRIRKRLEVFRVGTFVNCPFASAEEEL